MNRSAPVTPPTRHGRRRLAFVVAVAGGLALAVAGVTVGTARADAPPAVVDGEPVTRSELAFQMERVRPLVENALSSDPTSTVDWDAEIDGVTGAETLRRAALDQARADRALVRLANEHGLAPFDDFADFERTLESANASRQQNVAQGDVVYGLTAFDDAEFYAKTMADLREQVQRELRTGSGDTDALEVDDDEIRAAYRADPARWGAETSVLHTTRLALPADAAPPASGGPVVTEARFADLSARSSVTLTAVDVDPAAEATGGHTVSPAVLAQLQTMTPGPGATTDPTVEQGSWVTYRLDSTTVDETAALERYGERIRATLVDQQLTDLLHRLTSRQLCQIDQRAWQGLDPEETNR